MTDKHTSGPWVSWQDTNGRFHVGPSPNYSVAALWITPMQEHQANARLIAAAPDLLNALRRVLEWAEAVAGDNRFAAEAAAELASIELANAAIAKATGGVND